MTLKLKKEPGLPDATKVPFLMIALSFVLHIFLIPALPGSGAEVRGNGEMFLLNGPSWSLLFEYIGNILCTIITSLFDKSS